MNRKMNKWRMGLALPVLCALLFMTALPSAANYAYDGFEVKNMINGAVQGDVFASYGDKAGLPTLRTSPPQVYRTNYSVPGGTAVSWARLYVGIWGGTELRTGWVNTTLNGTSLGNVTLGGNPDSNPTYSSGTNAYNTGNGVWMVSYNCTNNVTLGATNQAVATVGGGVDGRVYGIVLVVVYENTSLPKVQYWVNEGNVNLHGLGEGGFPSWELNNNVAWFNGTAYNCTEAKQTVLYYTGSTGEHDYLYLNAPYAYDSPYNLSNIYWNIDGYKKYQLDGNDVANAYSDYTCTCDDDSVSTSYFDLNCFSKTNNSTPICDIINHTDNNYAIFWRGHDDNNSGTIDGTFNASGIEGEAYVHPIVAVLVLKDITHVYDFSDNYTGTPGVDVWAYEGQVSSKPPTTNGVPSGSIGAYSNIEADDGTYETYVTTSENNYAAQRFNFSIDETAPEKINVTWNGKGWHDTLADGAYLYIWNGTAYKELANNGVDSDETLTGEVTSSISNYINSGNVTVLVVQKSADDGWDHSHIETDYVKLVVTPDP